MSDFKLNSFDSDDDDDSDYVPSDDEEVIHQDFETLSDTKVRDISVETTSEPSPVDRKERIDSLWKQFLDSACDSRQKSENTDTNEAINTRPTISKSETSYDEVPCKPSTSKQTLRTSSNEEEIIKPENSYCSKKEDKVKSQDISAKKRSMGLSSLLGKIQNKKPKITTLQKSLTDWESFKKDEGIGSDLEIFNRGKSGYLERQAFLMRSDLRSFEVEKSIRLAKK